MRPEWDDVWMEVARAIAKRSLCSRAQVGAVIVSADNRVMSAAYNGPPPDFPHEEKPCIEWCPRAQPGADLSADYSKCESGHAEISALVRCDASKLADATIYVTGAVCVNCARSICHTGISRVVHEVHEADAHRHPEQVEKMLQRYHRRVRRYVG